MAAISSFNALFTSRCLASSVFFSNSSDTMIALKAWPQPPLMSSTCTCDALSFSFRVAVREAAVTPESVVEEAAAVSVSAAMGVGVLYWGSEVLKGRDGVMRRGCGCGKETLSAEVDVDGNLQRDKARAMEDRGIIERY